MVALADNPQYAVPTRKRHLMFCRQVAMGMEPSKAYRKYCAGAYRKAGIANRQTCFEQATRFSRRWGEYIADLRNKLRAQIDQQTIASKVELLQWHTRALRTPGELAADPESDLATVTVIDGPDGKTVKVQGPSKADHAAAIAKLAGFDAPQQVQVTHALADSPALARLGSIVQNARSLPIRPPASLTNGQMVKESIHPPKDCEIAQAAAIDVEWSQVEGEKAVE